MNNAIATLAKEEPRQKYLPRDKQRFALNRERLPRAAEYYPREGILLTGRGRWRDARCPFHNDTKPSLRVLIFNGAFRCMVSGAHGGDVLAFHMLRHGLGFLEAAKALGAWETVR